MAVIDGVPGLEAWVCVNGKRATEYDPDDEVEEVKPPSTTKYIESVSGASFTIHFKSNHSYQWSSKDYVLGIHWRVDGNIPHGWHPMSRSEEVSLDGRRSFDAQGRQISEHFRFGDIKTVETLEKTRIAEDRTIASKLGVIQVEVKRKIAERVEVVEQKPQHRRAIPGSSSNKASNTPSTVESKTSNQTLEIAEKAIKGRAISNLVSFGPAQIVQDSAQRPQIVNPPVQRPLGPRERRWRGMFPNAPRAMRERSPARTPREMREVRERSPDLKRWETKYSGVPEDKDRPIAVFRFLYRSIDDLQKMQIVPADQSTLLLETLSETEIRKLAKAHLDHINGTKGVQAEKQQGLKR